MALQFDLGLELINLVMVKTVGLFLLVLSSNQSFLSSNVNMLLIACYQHKKNCGLTAQASCLGSTCTTATTINAKKGWKNGTTTFVLGTDVRIIVSTQHWQKFAILCDAKYAIRFIRDISS